MQFPRSSAVSELLAQATSFCHSEYPFLDREYSPGGYYPFTDFTLNIAEWLRTENLEAIRELWSFLTNNGDADRFMLEKCLRVNVIPELELDESTAIEAKAIYLLSSRQSLYDNSFSSVAILSSRLLASRLASIAWVPPLHAQEPLHHGASIEANVMDGPGIKARRVEKADAAIQELLNPVSEANQNAGQWLIQIPPMTRLVIADYFARNWGEGRLRPELYYTERKYGCSVPWNLHFIRYIDCFVTPTDATPLPSSVTKPHLQEALSSIGIGFKKSAKKDDLLVLAKQHEGLISGLFRQYAPEYQTPRPEWKEALKIWAERIEKLDCVAATILKAMGMQATRLK